MEDAKIEDALQIAVVKLGFVEAKEKQTEAAFAFASGKDVFVSLPTGYGKSLCYASLPYLFDILKTDEAEAGVYTVQKNCSRLDTSRLCVDQQFQSDTHLTLQVTTESQYLAMQT